MIRAELPHVRDQFPRSYFAVKEELAKTARRASILNTNTYRDKCRTQKITEQDEQENLLLLLDRIGVVVKYDDTTLLDPNWLTTAVYRILTHADVVTAGGEFSVSEIGALLAGLSEKLAKQYPSERWTFISEMMERFGLSFKLPTTKDRYLVPNRFPVEEPDLPGWDETGLLRFRYEYQDTPPRGLLPRFVVLAHRHLTRPRIAWLNGVILGIDGCEVLVKMEPHKRRVAITVRGPEASRRSALTVVREHFAAVHELNKLVPGADVFTKIPVSVLGYPDAAFDFETLLSLERDGVHRVTYLNTNAQFEIKGLLTGVGPEPLVVRNSDEVLGPDELSISRGRVHESGALIVYGNVGAIYDRSKFRQSHQEANVGDKINIGGNVSGSAVGRGASVTAEQIVTNIRQQLPSGASSAEELKKFLEAALTQLAAENLDPDDHKEAKDNVERIEKETAKSDPNKDRVRGWVEAIERISPVTGRALRAASWIAARFA
ncbi:Uncharacterized protein OS=Candidatus Entotheonella sp. TSY2 GN=ETSY2_49915 PE=4 SV=1 [Gemmata massiliana]|uniref:Uncharacterized protein n=1 Tax=Gemmata massiliana TaxID=1210884 RepID=A0A6P2D5Z7_9BACT|nr:Uncharacterized protein OS=Candidatus Entotheonella sp. TSY2 GN=ETSY2_49915 PE=4 SV=1 [Gemmata massiliana]